MEAAALVAGGAVAGALARWRLSSACSPSWPAIAAINVAGSFALGVAAGRFGGAGSAGGGAAATSAAAAAAAHAHAQPRVMLAAGTGFMGAFTTFSTFSLDVVTLVEAGALARAAALAAGTPALGVGAAAAGLAIGRRWLQQRAAR